MAVAQLFLRAFSRYDRKVSLPCLFLGVEGLEGKGHVRDEERRMG